MDTAAFFAKILPSQGIYVLAECLGHGLPFNHTTYKSISEMATAALALDQAGRTIYHARASFNEDRPPNSGLRTKENVLAIRSLAIDIDVDPGNVKKYPTLDDARTALVFTLKQIRLPAPMVIRSGNGLHCYWPFTRDVYKDEAERLCEGLKKALRQFNFLADPAITANTAAVLRPIGTHWRKVGEREVVLLLDAGPYAVEMLAETLSSFVEPPAPIVPEALAEWSTGTYTYPPSSGRQIIKHCKALAEIANVGGAVDEPLWWAALGIAKYTTEGAELAHAWSAGDPRYSPQETDEKFTNGWNEGPPSCQKIRDLGGACGDCSHTCSSPIHLGYTVPEDPPAAPDLAPEDHHKFAYRLDVDQLPIWRPSYRWSGTQLEGVVTDEKGVVTWEAFCERLFYPYARARREDGTMVVRICVLGKRGLWSDFELPTETFADTRAFLKCLAAHEIIPNSKEASYMVKNFTRDIMRSIELFEAETMSFDSFGWHGDGFVIGDTMLRENDEMPVFLNKRIPPHLRKAMNCAGCPIEWSKYVNLVYNRPGAEPYQFAILGAFAAPLIKLVGSELWHGIPIALTGDSGLGKTTVGLVGTSAFATPGRLLVSAHEAGTSMNALLQTVAAVRNLPVILDEVHDMPGANLPTLLYALSNGKPKSTLRADRSFRDDFIEWDTVSYITSNVNINDLLAGFNRARAEATQLRVFEITLDQRTTQEVFAGINVKHLIDNQLLPNHYGHVGRRYIQEVIKHRTLITEQLRKLRAVYDATNPDSSRERFYIDLVAAVLVAGKLAKHLKIVDFDISAIERWARQHIQTLNTTRDTLLSDFESRLHQIFTALVPRTVQTRRLPVGSVKNAPIEHVNWGFREPPIARHAVEENILVVPHSGLREICNRLQIPTKQFVDECYHHGLLVPTNLIRTKTNRIYPFRGTDLPNAGTQTTCVIFSLNAIEKTDALPPENLVPFTKHKEKAA